MRFNYRGLQNLRDADGHFLFAGRRFPTIGETTYFREFRGDATKNLIVYEHFANNKDKAVDLQDLNACNYSWTEGHNYDYPHIAYATLKVAATKTTPAVFPEPSRLQKIFRRTPKPIPPQVKILEEKQICEIVGEIQAVQKKDSPVQMYNYHTLKDYKDKVRMLEIEIDTGLPVLQKPITTLAQAEQLLKIHPYFIAKIDAGSWAASTSKKDEKFFEGYPEVLVDDKIDEKAVATILASAMSDGIEAILENQQNMGVKFDVAEQAQREEFVAISTNMYNSFTALYEKEVTHLRGMIFKQASEKRKAKPKQKEVEKQI